MPAPPDFAANLISTGASGYGNAAAYVLLERHPEVGGRFGKGALANWSRHLTERARELAAAILVEEPALFASEVAWSQVGFASRAVPVDDLRASLECLRDALAAELPEQVRGLPGEYFETALAGLSEREPRRAPMRGAEVAEARLTLEYLEAALSGRRRKAVDLVLDAVDGGLEVDRAFSEVLEAAQILVGEMWHAREVSVAQEHFVTATSEVAMTLLAQRTVPPRDGDHTVVLTVAPGNAHELGAKTLSHRFEREGWNTIYLGSELPAAEAAGALESFDADLLAISIAMSVQLPAALKTVRLAREVRPGAKVLLGGRVFGVAPDLWQKLGADGSAVDAPQAVAVARRLVEA